MGREIERELFGDRMIYCVFDHFCIRDIVILLISNFSNTTCKPGQTKCNGHCIIFVVLANMCVCTIQCVYYVSFYNYMSVCMHYVML